MCGICGFYGSEDKDLIKSMTKLLRHRGPDDTGIFTDKNISLGHTRLSIIDLSKAGHQPMSNKEGILTISYNGEIYNYKELRKDLEKKGYKFSSSTDTEVVLSSYQEYGEKCIEQFNGMFAFAIWDSTKKSLFIARDRLGIKPLYYYYNKTTNHLIFSSEIKSILLYPDIPRKINFNALNNYLNLRYIPGSDTLFQNIKKLLPGHTLTIGNDLFKLKPFWHLPLPKSDSNPAELKERLSKSIELRLQSDVPVGVYLSGGIDSASIVALTSKLKNELVKTFTVGFNSEYDELPKARIIADHYSTDHHEITVDGNIVKMLPKIIYHLDQPHGDPVIIPMIKLSELASKKVKVVLSGEGADETLGGYVQYKTMRTAQTIKHLPPAILKTLSRLAPIPLLDLLYDYPSSIGKKGKEKLKDFISELRHDGAAYSHLISILSNKDREELGIQKPTIHFDNNKPLLNKILHYDTVNWLPNYPLYLNDRMTMANSIEGRVPFLDHTFVEYANSLPIDQKLGRTDKVVLRHAMKESLPKSKKHAFLMPLDNWFDQLKSEAQRLFIKSPYENFINKIVANYPTSKLLYGKQLFTFLSFGIWKELFIDTDNWKKFSTK
jgi:asparagine synthase (glutamine-hydrolysing)